MGVVGAGGRWWSLVGAGWALGGRWVAGWVGDPGDPGVLDWQVLECVW